jgi:hypothetical protein
MGQMVANLNDFVFWTSGQIAAHLLDQCIAEKT